VDRKWAERTASGELLYVMMRHKITFILVLCFGLLAFMASTDSYPVAILSQVWPYPRGGIAHTYRHGTRSTGLRQVPQPCDARMHLTGTRTPSNFDAAQRGQFKK
jgi:hypothetical protein